MPKPRRPEPKDHCWKIKVLAKKVQTLYLINYLTQAIDTLEAGFRKSNQLLKRL